LPKDTELSSKRVSYEPGLAAMSIIPAFGRLRRENHEFEDSLGYTLKMINK
jgi:hypothetical protein